MAEARRDLRCRTARRSPRCSRSAPLHRVAGLRSLVLSSYQAVSGAGQKGTRELAEQVEKLARPGGVARAIPTRRRCRSRRAVRASRSRSTSSRRSASSKPDGFTGEEAKMMAEPRKILSLPDLRGRRDERARAGGRGHAVSILATFDRPIDVEEAREVLADSPGVVLMDDPEADVFPTPARRRRPRRRLRRPDQAGARPRRRARCCSAAPTTCARARRSTRCRSPSGSSPASCRRGSARHSGRCRRSAASRTTRRSCATSAVRRTRSCPCAGPP